MLLGQPFMEEINLIAAYCGLVISYMIFLIICFNSLISPGPLRSHPIRIKFACALRIMKLIAATLPTPLLHFLVENFQFMLLQ